MEDVYFLVPNNQVRAFEIQCSRWKAVKPIKIKTPDAYILPYDLIYDEEVKGVLNPNRLERLDTIYRNEIEFIDNELLL